MNDMICWMTDEGSEWLVEHVDELTVEFVRDYVKRTEETANRLVDGWRRNGERVDLDIYFEINSLQGIERIKREKLINTALVETETGFIF
jgi:hypothetical protein